MNILLSFTIGVLTGLLLTGRNDSFIGSLRKWINETSRENKKKREEIEETIEKNLPDFHTWVKQGAERRRKSGLRSSVWTNRIQDNYRESISRAA